MRFPRLFQRRKTHPIPLDFPEPPESWETPFKKMPKHAELPRIDPEFCNSTKSRQFSQKH